MRRRRPTSAFDLIRQADREARKLAGTTCTAMSPVDLSRSFGEREWRAIRALRTAPRYTQAVDSLRARYAVVSNPLLLPNTLQETMVRRGLDLAEAVLAVALGEQETRAH